MTTFWKKVVKDVGYFLAGVIVFAAILVSVSRLMTPIFYQHRLDFEKWASQLLERPVTIGQVYVSWNIYAPELTFDNVTVLDQQTHQPQIKIPRLKVDLDILRSVLHWQPILESIKVAGVHLNLYEQPSGQIHLEGFGDFTLSDKATGESVNTAALIGWIFSQPYLLLEKIHIDYKRVNGDENAIVLHELVLQNKHDLHELDGQATLNQPVPTKVTMHTQWQGSVSDLPHVDAKLYFYVQGVSLPQWFAKYNLAGMKVQQGVGTARLWATWRHDRWQTFQSKFQLYDVVAVSSLTQKPISILRMSGNVGWKRQGDSEVIAGDNLLIDLPNRLWPTTGFTLQFSRTPEGAIVFQTIQASYLSLADSAAIAEATGWVTPDNKAILAALNPRGDVKNLQLTMQNSITDSSHVKLSADLVGFSMNAWKDFPGLKNINASVSWDGNQGQAKLNSTQVSIELPHVFANLQRFDQLSGNMQWRKDASENWQITANQLHAANADLSAQVDMSLTVPPTGSPLINLSGQFAMMNAARISDYLPLKIFDPDLVKWLRHAFLQGQVDSGKAILQGRLTDFPYDTATTPGKFEITGHVKNVSLNYAPDWPILREIEGYLVFSGSSMKVNVNSGRILNNPIGPVVADIPYLGDKQPVILNVQGNIKSDLADALQFIQKSPLKNTLGKDLLPLQLTGPLQLKLGLSIPLKNPDDVKVSGDALMTNAVLKLSEWDLVVDQLNGAFQFTDQGISAKQLTGKLFNQPIALTLLTEKMGGKNNRVVANVSGNISVAGLRDGLKLPVENLLQGESQIQAQLLLASHASPGPTQVTVNSDLKGMAVNLPDQYGKKANETRNTQFILLADSNQPLKVKLIYGKLFSAAVAVRKNKNAMQFLGGELRLGSLGEANWRSTPGLFVTGNLDMLDWEKIQPYYAQFQANSNSTSLVTTKKTGSNVLFSGADLVVRSLKFSSLQLANIRIQIEKLNDALQIRLDNADMSGQIMWPLTSANKSVEAVFRRLNLTAQSSPAGKSTLDISSLPALSVTVNDLRYAGRPLGRAVLVTATGREGVSVKQLSMVSDVWHLQATGFWKKSGSQLQGEITSSNVSNLFTAWGFASSNLVGSSGDIQFDFGWPGALYSPSLTQLAGTLSIKLGKGRIINLSSTTNAEMGFGRMLNILSLQTLPRRLSLDFSDLFEKGYSFDSLKGDFKLNRGSAVTDNLMFDGPIARVEIAGRIGFVAKDCDLKLSVTPYVTASLPMVATIATANPLAGLATWVVGSVVSHAVSRVATYTYSVTGSWDNPIWRQESTRSIDGKAQ